MGSAKPKLVTVIALLGLVAVISLRIAYAWHQKIDSDEPQHLHVVWEVLQGGINYKDFFDNHAPLFSWLWSPILAVVGGRADALPWMRLTMLPCFLLMLYSLLRLSGRLFTQSAALFGTTIGFFIPTFFFTSLEFRADNLWATLWYLAVGMLLAAPLTLRRALLAGTLLGAALATSLKSTMFVGALGGAYLLAAFLLPQRDAQSSPRGPQLAQAGGLFVGVLIIPGLVVTWFLAHQALEQLYFCLVSYNTITQEGVKKYLSWKGPTALLVLAAVVLILRLLKGRAESPARFHRQAVFVLTSTLYALLLFAVWPISQRHSVFHVIPLLAVSVVGVSSEALRAYRVPLSRLTARAEALLLGVVFVGGLAWVSGSYLSNWTVPRIAHPVEFADSNDPQDLEGMLTAVLALTRSEEFVMEPKGEFIFRHRANTQVFEGISWYHLSKGTLKDTTVADLIRTSTTTIGHDSPRFTQETRDFMNQNYISVGPLRVLGSALTEVDTHYAFTVRIPAEYVIIESVGIVAGRLSERVFSGRGTLGVGSYEFTPESPAGGKLYLLWARAFDQGYRPLELDPDAHRSGTKPYMRRIGARQENSA